MQRMTIKAYAIKHKLSIYNVMKMVRAEKLHTDVVETQGKELTYILVEAEQEARIRDQIIPTKDPDQRTLEEEVSLLKAEVAMLKREVAALKSVRN